MRLKNYDAAMAAVEKTLSCVPAPKPGETPSKLYTGLQDRIQRFRTEIAAAKLKP